MAERGARTPHRYGGPWTEIKLGTLRAYLDFYARALHRQRFAIWYIDAFAGTGSRTPADDTLDGDLLVDEGVEPQEIDGSARIAMAMRPSFERLVFVEDNRRRFEALSDLCRDDRRCTIVRDDANAVVKRLCAETPWHRDRGIRAAMFLDPYGMSVEWSTLEAIAATRAVDLWYLFPLMGVFRQAALDPAALVEAKSAALTRVLGSDAWRRAFYPTATDLFGDTVEGRRDADVVAIESYVGDRLRDLFPLVLGPRTILHSRGFPLFSLFFAMANDSPKAIGLARRGADYILNSGSSSHVRLR